MDFSTIKQARYIKLGSSGQWAEKCIADGTLRLEYINIPYHIAKRGDASELKPLLSPNKSTDHARQIINFYHNGPETIWITFYAGQLWWTVTDSEVEYVEGDATYGRHIRKTALGWKNTSIGGTPLNISSLSGALTRSAGYRMTICDIQKKPFDYLMRKIQDQPSLEAESFTVAKTQMLQSLEALIKNLTTDDFEVLVDLIFSRSGWQRVSSLGGSQKTIDMEYLIPVTNERVIVQVKSSTNQKQLNEYLKQFAVYPSDKQLYVYHTASKLDAGSLKSCELIGPSALAQHTLSTGLAEWLLKKAG